MCSVDKAAKNQKRAVEKIEDVTELREQHGDALALRVKRAAHRRLLRRDRPAYVREWRHCNARGTQVKVNFGVGAMIQSAFARRALSGQYAGHIGLYSTMSPEGAE